MKKIFTLLSITSAFNLAVAQSTLLVDFETAGTKKISFRDYDGVLDSAFVNTDLTGNASAMCGRYIRKANTQFDNLKMYAKTKFVEISPFAQATTTSKIMMKVKSKMAVGTKIDIQLGSRQDQSFPGGVHSIYTGTTTVVNQWENLTFNLTNVPTGGFPLPGSIDKMIILFNTNAMTADTVYFDDIMGPDIEPAVGIQEMKNASFSVSQNIPNPSKDLTSINLELKNSGAVTMTICDMLGKTIATPVNGNLTAGTHTYTIETDNMPNGIYFYTVKSGNTVQTRKMVVSQ